MPRRRPILLAATVLLALVVALPAAAYVIYLRDGSKLIAQEPYVVRDGQAHIVLQNGTRTFIDAAEIDVARTEQANRGNLGAAVVIEGGEVVETLPAAPPPPPTLRDLVQRAPGPPARAERSPSAAAAVLPRTASGHVDLAAVPRRPLEQTELAAEIVGVFAEHGIEPVQVNAGTAGDRALVEATTSSEAAVFRALAVAAAAVGRLRQQGGDLAAIELLMTTPGGDRAGQFVLTPELATQLLDGQVDVATFFLAHVQF